MMLTETLVLTSRKAAAIIAKAHRPVRAAMETATMHAGLKSRYVSRTVLVGVSTIVAFDGKITFQGPADDMDYWLGMVDDVAA